MSSPFSRSRERQSPPSVSSTRRMTIHSSNPSSGHSTSLSLSKPKRPGITRSRSTHSQETSTNADIPTPISTSVSVSVRLRPLFSSERKTGATEVFMKESDTSLIEQKLDGSLQTWQFMHKCFGPFDTTAHVFETVCMPLINQLLDGFNASFFAYGQTASGKTHTIFGSEDEKGIIAEAMAAVFSLRTGIHKDTEDILDIKMSIIEIYNEQLSDLLNMEISREAPSILSIAEDPKLGVFVRGCKIVEVSSPYQAMQLLDSAVLRRSQGSTDLNQASSRSHAVVRLQVERKFSPSKGSRTSVCNFIDLAGSERAKRTGATGTALREASRINRSLMQLGLVISRLAEGRVSHVPYRSSKLTHLLTDALGGRSVAAMVTTCSPASTDREETLNSLKYAARAVAVKNQIVANETSAEGFGGGGFEVFRDEVENLRNQLAASESIALDREVELGNRDINIRELQEEVEKLKEGMLEIHQVRQMKSNSIRDDESWKADKVSEVEKLHEELQEKRDEIRLLREQLTSSESQTKATQRRSSMVSPTTPSDSVSNLASPLNLHFQRTPPPPIKQDNQSNAEFRKLQSKNHELETEVIRLRNTAAEERKKLESQLMEYIARTETELSARQSVSRDRGSVNPILFSSTKSPSPSSRRAMPRPTPPSPSPRSRSANRRLSHNKSNDSAKSGLPRSSPLRIEPRALKQNQHINSSPLSRQRHSIENNPRDTSRSRSMNRTITSSEERTNNSFQNDKIVTKIGDENKYENKEENKQQRFPPTPLLTKDFSLQKQLEQRDNANKNDMVIPAGFEFFVATRLNTLQNEIISGKKTDELLAMPVYVDEIIPSNIKSKTNQNSTSSSSSSSSSIHSQINLNRSYNMKKKHPWHEFWPKENMDLPLPNIQKHEKHKDYKMLLKEKNKTKQLLNKTLKNKSFNKKVSSDYNKKEEKEDDVKDMEEEEEEDYDISGLDIPSSDLLISMIDEAIQKNRNILGLAGHLKKTCHLSPRDFWFKYFSLVRSIRAAVIQQARAMANSSFLSDGAAGATGIVLRSVGTALSLPHPRQAIPPISFLRKAALRSLHHGIDLTLVKMNKEIINTHDLTNTNFQNTIFQLLPFYKSIIPSFSIEQQQKEIVGLEVGGEEQREIDKNNINHKIMNVEPYSLMEVMKKRLIETNSEKSLKLWIEKVKVSHKNSPKNSDNDQGNLSDDGSHNNNNIELFLVWKFYTVEILTKEVMYESSPTSSSIAAATSSSFSTTKSGNHLDQFDDFASKTPLTFDMIDIHGMIAIKSIGKVIQSSLFVHQDHYDNDKDGLKNNVQEYNLQNNHIDEDCYLSLISEKDPNIELMRFKAGSRVERDALVEAITLVL